MWEPLNGASVNGLNNKPRIRVSDRLMGIALFLGNNTPMKINIGRKGFS